MPRAGKPPSLDFDFKPYSKPHSRTHKPDGLQADADDIKKTSPRKARETTSRPWSTGELIALFEHVSKYGASGKKVWEGAVEGRTANQAYQTWLQNLAPYIRKAIGSKPTKSKA